MQTRFALKTKKHVLGYIPHIAGDVFGVKNVSCDDIVEELFVAHLLFDMNLFNISPRTFGPNRVTIELFFHERGIYCHVHSDLFLSVNATQLYHPFDCDLRPAIQQPVLSPVPQPCTETLSVSTGQRPHSCP